MMKDKSDESIYMGIAEEAAELSSVASKVARILHGEIPARMTIEEAKNKVQEEFTDLLIYMNELGITPSNDVYVQKCNRYLRSGDMQAKVGETDKIIADLKRDLEQYEQQISLEKAQRDREHALETNILANEIRKNCTSR